MRLFQLLPLMLVAAWLAPAQSSHGYVFGAAGATSGGGVSPATAHAGLGMEAVFHRWIGAGAEAGYVALFDRIGNGLFHISPNGYFHFAGDPFRGLDPYATAGYTLFFRSGTGSAFNYGVGLNWWFRENTGLKVEYRDHLAGDALQVRGRTENARIWGFRFGVTFRGR